MKILVQSVPNISEGRDQKKINLIVDELKKILGPHLLDWSADSSHNRTVITMAGNPTIIKRALIKLFELSINIIDLSTHEGEHPRIGAVDVVPIIPLNTSSKPDCLRLAKDLGLTVSQRFRLPVYLYEDSSMTPRRRRLEDIRRGQLTGISERMKQNLWFPDFGPNTPHTTAGISVIGVRKPLVAFNVNLASNDIRLARQIAKTVRASSGGLPCVKALGIRLDAQKRVQVSTNLTDYTKTSLKSLFSLVQREAQKEGVSIYNSEFIGLIPAEAIETVQPAEIFATNFKCDQILENRLRKAQLL